MLNYMLQNMVQVVYYYSLNNTEKYRKYMEILKECM